MKKWLALHGFLGDSGQWDFLRSLGIVEAIDLYPLMEMSKEELLDYLLKKVERGTKLIGYSMGGRIAMELFLRDPNKFSNLYILASHPGLEHKEDIKNRLLWENQWVEKLDGPRDLFIKDWNKQEIFKNDKPINFPNVEISQIKKCIEVWGLSKQDNLVPKLKDYSDKVIWLIGSEDKHYKKIAATNIKEYFYAHCVTGAGHRLLQHPNYILNCLKVLDRD